MTQVDIVNMVEGFKSGGEVPAQIAQGWGRAPNATSGQRSAELEVIASDCCQCGTHVGSTRSAF